MFRYSAAFLIHRQPAGTVRLVARNFSDLEDSFRMQGICADKNAFRHFRPFATDNVKITLVPTAEELQTLVRL